MPDNQNKLKREHVAGLSPDLRAELRDRLRDLAPEAFAEGKLDADKLKALLGENGDAGAERYSFSWAGKRDAISMLQVPTRATLIPDREQSVNFDEAQHVFIEGENLEVLKVLYRSYFGRVKMIYIDPPYNTGNDFIYPDDFADPLDHYLRITGQKNGNGDYTTSQVDKNGRIHSAWLSMMYPRLVLARQFLAEQGLIFVSIDEHEMYNLRMVMNEIFGEENFISEIVWKKAYGGGSKAKHIVGHHEYILVFAKNKAEIDRIDLPPNPETRRYYKFKDAKFEKRGPYRTQPLWTNSMDDRENLRYPVLYEGKEIWPEKQWQWSKTRTQDAQKNDELEFVRSKAGCSVYYKQYLYDEDGEERSSKLFSVLDGPYTQAGTDEMENIFGNGKVFSFPKPSKLVRKLVSTIWRDETPIIMDFFAGSCPTAQAIFEFNQEESIKAKFVLVQFPEKLPPESEARKLGFETIADVGRERIKRVLPASLSEANKGFRAFRLFSSNTRSWTGVSEKDSDALVTQIEAFSDTLVPGWKPENVIWETALREGYSLTSRIEKIPNTGKQTFWRVTDPDREQSFVICLDDTLTLDAVRALKLKKDALFVCRDTALDDTLSANLALQCRLKVL
ncbi:MAG: site-specific DNA-methyltransferase [Rhizobiales bacterium]|nr:site-specific DNA-methyltransferase [Hyphomicrobiales bacterium]